MSEQVYPMLKRVTARAPFFIRVIHVLAYSIVIGGFLLSLPNVSARLFDWLQIDPPVTGAQLNEAETGQPTAIVVLSAGRRRDAKEFGGLTVDALSLERVRYGAFLARETKLPVLVAGGGATGEPTLADVLAKTLTQDYDVTVRWKESKSGNTAENAEFSSAILKKDGISRIVLVTHAWHMRRSKLAFESAGLTVIPAPTAFYDPSEDNFWEGLEPSATTLRMSLYALHEIAGYFWYQFHYGFR